jgi:3-deoxy-D-manno-octulosonic-acid transferase
MHAPSVGEGLQARPVLQLARREMPQLQLAYTFFSPSAESFARGLDVDVADYLPFDTHDDARALLAALRPTALVFSKLDVWPVLAEEASRQGVRLGLVSATLAANSSRRGGIAGALLREAYSRLDAAGAIDADDAARLVELGVPASRVVVTGDTRYDQVASRAATVQRDGPLLGPLASTRPTLIAGSTWPADERVLLPAWKAFAQRGGSTLPRLLIAPHEPTPAHLAPISRWADDAGLSLSLLSDVSRSSHADIVLVDRVGVLGELYALADAAFVGGGFHSAGLHSVLEPAAFGAPVMFGPRHHASRDAALLLRAGGGAAVTSAESLLEMLHCWLDTGDVGRTAGDAARRVVQDGVGAAERSFALVRALLARD